MTKPVMISVSGIRGIVGQGLTPELVVRYATAVGSYLQEGRVMVGQDSRVTGDMLKAAVLSGLLSVGCTPVDLSVCPTPTVQLAVQNSEAVGGIAITASHNPIEWNALKLLGSEGLFLDEKEGEKIKKIVEKNRSRFVPWDRIGQIERYEKAIDDHITAVLEIPYINVNAIQDRKFRVAFDCVNGAGGAILPKLLQKLGCTLFPLNEEPSGRFAHPPEPVPENLYDLCKVVQQRRADIGFAVDPDVDRLAIVAETGEPIGEEYTVTLAARFVLTKKKGTVVVNVSTTRAIDDVAKEMGVDILRTPVGEIHVAKKMKAEHSVIGGEGNGGVILPEVHLGRDAPVAIALTLQHLLEYEKPISKLWKDLPQYAITKKKIPTHESHPDKILKNLGEKYRNEALNWTDGLKISRPDSWIHIRPSNTEPVIRIIAEAKTKKESEMLCDRFIEEIQKIQKK